MAADKTITHAAIHPAIGIARLGGSKEFDGFFLGPQVPDEPALGQGAYKDKHGALKRQAAGFRIYGYNAAGEVVAELTLDNATIEWTVELANKKAAWYQFQLALDIPEASAAATPPSARRNATVAGSDRGKLAILPKPRAISGRDEHGPRYHFDDGHFFHLPVELGELRTDDDGRLHVLGGFGLSQSLSGTPPTTFANNDGWHDDTSDGPVDAKVTLDGKQIPVEGAWIVVAPPNYAPALKTTRTLYDLLYDRMISWGLLTPPAQVSFERHIRPIFERLTGLQWVNRGFASWFGTGAPFDFEGLLPRLADLSDGNIEFRQRMYSQFRVPQPTGQQLGKLLWPQFFGDALDSLVTPSPQNPDSSKMVPDGLASLGPSQLLWLRKWADGKFVAAASLKPSPQSLTEVDVADQPAALDEAALAFCLADAFHPGCELTWPMRHHLLYSGPFRIKRRPASSPEPDFGTVLTPTVAVSPTGPLAGATAGDLTRWMAVPWQTDTASCLSGYSFFQSSPSLPSFWPARVPNQVLREVEYDLLMDSTKSKAARLAAFHQRVDWLRAFGKTATTQMITKFNLLGIVEERSGPRDIPGVPSRVWVESKPDLKEPATSGPAVAALIAPATASPAGGALRQIGRYGQAPE
jgi:hypothetical protein